MHLGHYLLLVHQAQVNLGSALRDVGQAHQAESDVRITCSKFALQCDQHVASLEPFVDRYAAAARDEPDRLRRTLFDGTRSGALGLLRDLHDLHLMTCECDICWTMIGQAAQCVRDAELLDTVRRCDEATQIHGAWVRSRMKQAAPQALVVAE